MAPRRSGRRSVSAYKKGDFIEYSYKGNTVTGKLFKKSSNGTEASPIWVVTPTDRRRRNEEVPEKALGKIIDAQEAMSNKGPKLKKGGKTSPTNSNSDGSADEAQDPKPKRRGGGGRGGSPGEDNSGGSSAKKRKSVDSNVGPDKKYHKSVSFSQESKATGASKKKGKKAKKAAKTASGARVGTRSSRGSGAPMVLLPDHPIRKRNMPKAKKVRKDENVKVIKMLTGTLYLYRGERPRAEFVRTK